MDFKDQRPTGLILLTRKEGRFKPRIVLSSHTLMSNIVKLFRLSYEVFDTVQIYL